MYKRQRLHLALSVVIGGMRSSNTASACKNQSSGLVVQKVGRVAMPVCATGTVTLLVAPPAAPDVDAVDSVPGLVVLDPGAGFAGPATAPERRFMSVIIYIERLRTRT